MSAAVPNPTPAPEAASRGSQVALGVLLSVLVTLLAVRGYGNRFDARPTEPAVADVTDLNTATAAELAQVPGVGPKTAEAIVEHRRQYGPFKSVDDLDNVRGIGPAKLAKMRSHLRAGPHTVAPAEVPPSPKPPVAVPVALPRPVAAVAGAKKLQPGDPPIDVNSATADELQRIPGVGPVTAQAIITARAVKPFASTDDLDRVKGVGPKTLDKLRPYVAVR